MNKVLKIGGLPVKAHLERVSSWNTSKRQMGKRIVFSFKRDAQGVLQKFNQRAAREAFMAIDTPEAALAFFQKHGPFQRTSKEPSRGRAEEAQDIDFARVVERQDLFRAFIAEPAPQCFRARNVDMTSPEASRGFDALVNIHAHESPHFTVEMGHDTINGTKVPAPFLQQYAFDVETAVYNSIYIDKMAGLKGAMCMREGCREVFLSDSDKPRRFCTDRCANAHRQKEYRKAKTPDSRQTAPPRPGRKKTPSAK